MSETPVRKGKRGPIPRPEKEILSEMLGIRVTPDVKHIYSSIAKNFGLTETDLFYNLMAIGSFMDIISPMIRKELDAKTNPEMKEKNDLWFARFQTMMKAFSLISDIETQRKYVRGKNQNTNAKQVAEIGEHLIPYLEKNFRPK